MIQKVLLLVLNVRIAGYTVRQAGI